MYIHIWRLPAQLSHGQADSIGTQPSPIKSIWEFQRHTIYLHIYIHTYVSFLYCFHIIALHAVNARTVVQTLGTTRQVSFHCTTICQCHCTTHRQVLYGLLLCHSWHSSSSSSCSYSSSCPLGIVLVLRIDSQHASKAPLKTRMIS